MRFGKSVFAGPAALHAIAAGLLFSFGCGTAEPGPSDLSGSGGGGAVGSGGVVGSGGAPAPSGGAPSDGSGGVVGSGGAPVGSGGAPSDGGAPTGGAAGSGGTSTFFLTSPAFENVDGCSAETPSPCDLIPDENVSYMDQANVSPELSWTGAPAGTQSYALALFDVTYGQAHWVLWNIPADTLMLTSNVPQDTKMPAVPAGSEQANANFADTSTDGYFGGHMPCNVMEFQLFALSVPTFTPADTDSAVLIHIELQKLEAELLGVTRLRGRVADYGMTCP